MLPPIPKRILRDTAVFSVPKAFDRYQKPTETETYTVRNVHIQADNSTRKTADNTEVVLRGILFVDARYSAPLVDFEKLQETAQKAGGVMTCTVTNRHGTASGPYSVLVVDGLPDDQGRLHHYELGLV